MLLERLSLDITNSDVKLPQITMMQNHIKKKFTKEWQ
jgi:hypothetical protein